MIQLYYLYIYIYINFSDRPNPYDYRNIVKDIQGKSLKSCICLLQGKREILKFVFFFKQNLSDVSPQAIEEMVDSGLIKTVDLLLKGNLKDQDVIDDVKYVGDVLEKNMKILTYKY